MKVMSTYSLKIDDWATKYGFKYVVHAGIASGNAVDLPRYCLSLSAPRGLDLFVAAHGIQV